MRAAVVLVLALLAFGAVSMSEARRIHRMKAQLRADEESEAVEAIDVDAAASLPFDDDYWTAGGKAEFSKALKAASKGAGLSTAQILKKFFSDDNILLAQQQTGTAKVRAQIGEYSAVAQQRSCNQGTCDDNWVNIDMASKTGTITAGAAGTVVLECTTPADMAQSKCEVTFYINGGANYIAYCLDVGGAGKSCSVPSYQYQSGSTFYGRNFVTDTKDGLDIFFNSDRMVVNYKYHGTTGGKLVFNGIGIATTAFSAYKITVNPAAPAALPALTKASKAAQLTTAQIIAQFFSPDNVLLAQQQNEKKMSVEISGYNAVASSRQCDKGVCGTWNAIDMAATTGTVTLGATGKAKLECTAPADMAQSKCEVTFYINGGSSYIAYCLDVGGVGKSCSVPSYQYISGSTPYGRNFVTDTKEVFNVYFTAEALVANWRYRGNTGGKLVGTDITIQTSESLKSFKIKANPPFPLPEAALTTARKAAQLDTAKLLAKFFTKDNIALAQMQGVSVPVKATIGAYRAGANSRSCDKGWCTEFSKIDMSATTGTVTAGAEGSVVLQCTVPKDLAQAKCEVTFYINGAANYLFYCTDVGGAGKSCSVPSYLYQSGSTFYGRNFVTDTKEAVDILFTNDALVVYWRYRGNTGGKLITTEITAQTSTPFADFNTPAKTNCLSKTTTADVMAAAASKLKNKVTLTSTAVDALIKGAPYKTVGEAITKIKGIGPVNVVYVSFMWNFEC